MDTNMEDVSRAPADVSPVQTEPATIGTLDGWIESLMSCKQLAESDVQRLCDKVRSMIRSSRLMSRQMKHVLEEYS
jgi:serine/threonine-protein phosphatase 2A catalytic subunit